MIVVGCKLDLRDEQQVSLEQTGEPHDIGNWAWRDVYVGSALIKMYADVGLLGDASEVFDAMAERDYFLWKVMMDGCIKGGKISGAVGLFWHMRASGCNPNFAMLACFFCVCATHADLLSGVQLHSLAVKCGLEPEVAVADTLLAMYAKCRCLDGAWRLFDLMPWYDLVSWNRMISGCVQNVLPLGLLCDMQESDVQPDSVTLVPEVFYYAQKGSASPKGSSL